MGSSESKSKPAVADNTGSVINEIKILQSSIQNKDLIFLLYVIEVVVVLNFVISLYKMWHKSVKKTYLQRGAEDAKI